MHRRERDSKWKFTLTPFFLCCPQASEEASLRALESLMTEFFHNCTTNERKREIGECKLLLGAGPVGSLLPGASAEDTGWLLNTADKSALPGTELASQPLLLRYEHDSLGLGVAVASPTDN